MADAVSDIDITSDITDGAIDGAVSVHANDVPANRGAEKPAPDTPVVTDTQEKPDKAASLRDQISSALKGEAETPDTATQDGRVRNPDGTFAPRPVEQQQSAGAPVFAPPGIDPAVFSTLPAETQQVVARTMEVVNNQAMHYGALERVIAPRYQAWALNGMTPDQAVNQLLALSDFAGRDPAGFVKYFAQQQNLNLEDLAFGPDPVDPTVAALQNQIAQLQNGLTAQQQQQQAQQQQALIAHIAQEIEAKDANGAYLYPHVEELGDGFLPYIQIVRQQNPNASVSDVIKNAYEQACWANPNIRTKLQQAQQQQQNATQLADKVVVARKAAKAGTSVASSAPTPSATAATSSGKGLRDTIKESLAAAST